MDLVELSLEQLYAIRDQIDEEINRREEIENEEEEGEEQPPRIITGCKR